MPRIFGIIKVTLILALDFMIFYGLFQDIGIAIIAVGIIGLYVVFGGYIAILKDGAVYSKKLSAYQQNKLNIAKTQLVDDVKSKSNLNISHIKLYLVPNNDLNATAYGFNCISVTQSTLNNTDPHTLNSVLAHEISHILNLDAEFNRAVFASVTLLVGAIGIFSFVTMLIITLLFLLLGCFGSFLGFMAFNAVNKMVRGMFRLLQRGTIFLYQAFMGLACRHAEYRSDKYACQLGYGLQLSQFLTVIESLEEAPLTLTEVIYRSHPSTTRRIARLRKQRKSTAAVSL